MNLKDLKVPPNASVRHSLEIRHLVEGYISKKYAPATFFEICAVAALYWRKAVDDAESFSLESEEADAQIHLWQQAAFAEDEK